MNTEPTTEPQPTPPAKHPTPDRTFRNKGHDERRRRRLMSRGVRLIGCRGQRPNALHREREQLARGARKASIPLRNCDTGW